MARTDVHHYTWHAYWQRRSKLLVVKVTWTMCTTAHFYMSNRTWEGRGRCTCQVRSPLNLRLQPYTG